MPKVTFANDFSYRHPELPLTITDYPKGYAGDVSDAVAAAAEEAGALQSPSKAPPQAQPKTTLDAVGVSADATKGKIEFERP